MKTICENVHGRKIACLDSQHKKTLIMHHRKQKQSYWRQQNYWILISLVLQSTTDSIDFYIPFLQYKKTLTIEFTYTFQQCEFEYFILLSWTLSYIFVLLSLSKSVHTGFCKSPIFSYTLAIQKTEKSSIQKTRFQSSATVPR